MALPKKNRLTTKKDIDHVFKNGRTVKGSSLFIRFLGNGKGYARVAFLVPTKHVPLAVDRNRIKRKLSAEVARISLSLEQDLDVIVIVSKKINREEIDNLVGELKELLLTAIAQR